MWWKTREVGERGGGEGKEGGGGSEYTRKHRSRVHISSLKRVFITRCTSDGT